MADPDGLGPPPPGLCELVGEGLDDWDGCDVGLGDCDGDCVGEDDWVGDWVGDGLPVGPWLGDFVGELVGLGADVAVGLGCTVGVGSWPCTVCSSHAGGGKSTTGWPSRARLSTAAHVRAG